MAHPVRHWVLSHSVTEHSHAYGLRTVPSRVGAGNAAECDEQQPALSRLHPAPPGPRTQPLRHTAPAVSVRDHACPCVTALCRRRGGESARLRARPGGREEGPAETRAKTGRAARGVGARQEAHVGRAASRLSRAPSLATAPYLCLRFGFFLGLSPRASGLGLHVRLPLCVPGPRPGSQGWRRAAGRLPVRGRRRGAAAAAHLHDVRGRDG